MHYYDQYTRGEITIEELRQCQANDMPRCVDHAGRPAWFGTPAGWLCEECAAVWIAQTRLWRKAQAVVVGGMEEL